VSASPQHDFHTLRVAAVAEDGEGGRVVTLEVPDDRRGDFAFRAGQHLTVRRHLDGEEVRRSYSICSPAGSDLRVGVRHVPGGRFSGWVHEHLTVGDELEVMAPTGSFVLDDAPAGGRHHVAVAAGSGITPVLSIVASALEGEPESTVSLLFVNRTVASTMFLEELQALKDRHLARFRLTFAFTREPGEVDLLSGRPDGERLAAWVAAGILPTDGDRYWLCGPDRLVDELVAVLAAAGVEDERVHHELFGTSVTVARTPVEGPPGGAKATITLNGRTSVVPVEPGQSVLEAARAVRGDVPYSCTAGVCATCRAHLDEGTVERGVIHGLTPTEIDAGFVLTCQARPTSETLLLDYDA
jgi:ring-1,2-phenylacetyl-CoA epoxidase subunit PaaE